MSNYDGKIELPQTYHNQGNEQHLSSDKPDTYLWLAEENTKQAKEIERLQEQLKDANKVIKKYSDGTIYLFPTWYNGSRLAEAYLEKWGVK